MTYKFTLGVLGILIIFTLVFTPTRLIIFDESKQSFDFVNTLLIKNKYLTSDKLENYENYSFRVDTGSGGCQMYEMGEKRLVVKGWYSWKDTISSCGLHN